MIVTELYIKNFGKFTEKRFHFKNGVQVIAGENEFGKTTLHAFIRAMLFGMERGRGRAAARDAFSRYEPWDNPACYAGSMRFVCGGRNFRLDRDFSRHQKSASLICEDDGEELSLEHGDLDMLLGGLTPEIFDSTVSVGQLKAEPGQELYGALENYAANYLETGGGEFDLEQAFGRLKERRKKLRRDLQEEQQAFEEARADIRKERQYLEREVQALRQEYEQKAKSAVSGRQRRKAESAEGPEGTDGKKSRKSMGAGRAGLLLLAALLILGGVFCLVKAWYAAGGILLAAGAAAAGVRVFLAGREREAQDRAERAGRQEQQEREEQEREQKNREERTRIELARIRAEQREKTVRIHNLTEQYEEVQESPRASRLKEKIRAVELAQEKLESAARMTGDPMAVRAGKRASAIFREITDGKYRSVELDRQKGITVWDGVRKIPAYRLSRGTLEQIYFSVRMAAAEILLEEPVPLLLDDVFAFYDDKRLESVLKWLSRQEKQVIIFTCHKREEDILARIRS